MRNHDGADVSSRVAICHILPPHILEHMANHADPSIRNAAQMTLIATHGLRVQRGILALGAVGGVPTGVLRRTIYDARNGDNLPGQLVRGENSGAGTDPAVNEAYDWSGLTYTFYQKVLGRNSIDDRGMRLDSTVHYREDPAEGFDNAFWNGEQMVYGDGDGTVFKRFTLSLDVVGHELTHGVTEFEAGLVYHVEPGALNESMSDVFGSMVRQYHAKPSPETVKTADWLVGKELFVKPGLALRSLKAPGTAYDDPDIGKDPQPDHMTKFVRLPDTRRGDYGGVHINSGIPNRAFYEACVNLGDTYSWDKAGRIWYDALCNRLSTRASFTDARRATIAAAAALYTAQEAKAVEDAWRTVGVQ